MNKKEQAKIILEALDQYLAIDWNFEEYYIKGIVNGLIQIEKGSGFCSSCQEHSENLLLIITQDSPIGFCPVCLDQLNKAINFNPGK